MKKTVSFILTVLMIFSLFSVAFTAFAEGGVASIDIAESELVLFSDPYAVANGMNKSSLTLTLFNDSGFETDIETAGGRVRWSSNSIDVVTVSDGVLTAVAPGTATVIAYYYDEYDMPTSVYDTCAVTVRQSIYSHIEKFKNIIDEIPVNIEVPGTYTTDAVKAVTLIFDSIKEAYAPDYIVPVSIISYANDMLEVLKSQPDTEELCSLIDNYKSQLLTAVSNLSLNLLVTSLSEDEQTAFFAQWTEAFAAFAEKSEDYYMGRFTSASVASVESVLNEFSDTQWLVSDKDKLDALAADLLAAVGNLKYKTTDLYFVKTRVDVNCGDEPFKVDIICDGEEDITYESGDDNILSVDSNGLISVIRGIPEGYGKDYVRINAYSGDKSASVQVYVKNPVKSISASKNIAVTMGTEKQITVNAVGVDSSSPITDELVYTFTSSDPSIATVDSNGVITPVAIGTAEVTVLFENRLHCVVNVAVTKAVKISKIQESGLPSTVTVNDTVEAKLMLLPIDATNTEISWTSSDPSKAEIVSTEVKTSSGIGIKYAYATIKGLSEGKVTITYETTDGSNLSGSFNLTVRPLVSSLTLDSKALYIYIADTEDHKLTPTIAPSNAGNQTLRWFTSNESVATVTDTTDGKGKINPHSTGTCVIYCTTQDGTDITASCTVTVLGSAKDMTIDRTSADMKTGEKLTLTGTVTTEQGVVYNVTDFSSSDTSLATVKSNGVVTALLPGTVTITARYFDGTTRSCKIKITADLLGISILDSITLPINKSKTLTPTFNPEYATNKNVSWYSGDPEIVTVSSKGVIVANGVGTTNVTVVSEEGGFISVCKVTVIQPVTSVALNKTSRKLVLGSSDTVKLTASVSPSNASDKSVRWETSNKSIATVSSTGLVTAYKPGSCKITVKTNDGGFSATCSITVIRPLTGIKFKATAAEYYVGLSKKIGLTFTPSDASNKSVTYTSSNKSVASVSSNGTITAKKKGTATITATSADGGFKTKCKITVVPKVDVKSVSLDIDSMTINRGFGEKLTARVKPSNASNKSLKWSSSDTSIATVSSSGVVTGKKGGTCTIKCKTNDGGKVATCTVTVYQSVSSITLSITQITLISGKSKTVSATVKPSNATNKAVKWSTSNPDVATVSSKGVVKAVKAGSCTITCRSKDDTTILSKCKVTVLQAPKKVSLNEDDIVITKGKTAKLVATVSPKNAYDKTVKWSSTNKSVVSVSASGVITARRAGTASIVCSCTDYPDLKTSCTVTVVQPVTGLDISFTSLTLPVGKTKTLTATVKPSGATDKSVTYKTSNRNVARVSSKGVIEAVGPGTASITVITNDGFYSQKCTVTVYEPVTGISLSATSAYIGIGQSKTLTATVKPKKATNTDIIWRSGNSSVARVSQTGVVTALKEGDAVITATTVEGSFMAVCTVHCVIKTEAVTLNKSSVRLSKGKTVTLKATVYPDNATVKTLVWTSSNPKVATVDSAGKVKAVGKGTCIITCKTKQGGFKSSCTVKVG